MVDITSIQDEFDGLVGWRQPIDPDYDIIDSRNRSSSSGQYFQDISNLVSVENIKNLQSYVSISDEQFNTKLREITSSAVSKLMNNLFYDNDIVENRLLYDYAYDWQHSIANDSSFVGFEIEVANRKDLVSIINRVYSAFDGVDTVKLMLFHTSKKNPVQSVYLQTQQDNEASHYTSWSLPFTNGVSGGKYYIGYLTNGLTARAYNRDYESANTKNSFHLCSFKPVKVSGWNSETLFDVNDVEYVSETFGLNFDVTGKKDFTSVVMRNTPRFVNAYMLQVAADVLDLIIHSTRSNDDERMLKINARVELEGSLNNPELPPVIGIANKLKKELKELKETFLGVDRIVLGTLR